MWKLIGAMYNKFKKWISPSALSKIIEINRISSQPRFHRGKSKILGREIIFSDSSSFIQSYHEIFEQKLYAFKSEISNPLILDCGANIGLSIIYFKTIYPNARIIGFEPDPNLFEILKTNLAQFQLNDVELHQVAVLDAEEEVTFLVQGGSSGQVLKNHEIDTRQSVIKVDSITLTPFLSSTINFLKIDIEGAEFRVLKSISDQLHLVEKLFVEYHSFKNRGQELDLILNLLRNANFRYYLYPAVHKELPFNGIGDVEEMDMQLNIYAIRQ